MKDVKCKCSHLRSEHNKIFTSFCKVCACSEYLKYNEPNIWSKIGMIILGIGIGLLLIMVVGGLYLIMSLWEYEELINTQINITFGEFFGFASAVLVFIGITTCGWFFDLFLDYFREKRRKTFD